MSLIDAVYGSLREQDVKTETAVDLCRNLSRLNKSQQWVFLRKTQGYSQEEIGHELHRHRSRVSRIITGPLHSLASLLESAQ
jgi:DNA-directed RNA polymerase specialized sigma subunit